MTAHRIDGQLRVTGHAEVLKVVEDPATYSSKVSRFLQAGCLDRLQVTVAPLILGSGRPSFTLPEIDTIDGGLRPRSRHFVLGSDILFDCALRD